MLRKITCARPLRGPQSTARLAGAGGTP